MLGRNGVLDAIERLLAARRHVLLVGPAGVGKTALIETIAVRDMMIVDPFERVSSQRARLIRRGMDRGVLCLAATRSLDRAQLGCVGRIAWRFSVVRVPRLSDVFVRRLIARECASAGISLHLVTREWMSTALRLAQGRPGVAMAIVAGTARMWNPSAGLPAPATAYLESCIHHVGPSPST